MVEFISIPSFFWNQLNYSLIAHNNRSLPSIWVLGKNCGPMPSFIQLHDQHITFDILFHCSRHRISFVYSSNWRNKRMELWSDLLSLSQNFNSSWCVLEDFNSVVGAHEKTGKAQAMGPYRDF